MTDPADEAGYCLTTLHTFADDTFRTTGLAATDDGLYVYLGGAGPVGEIARLDTSSWTITTTWADPDPTTHNGAAGIVITAAGVLFVPVWGGSVSKITAAGTVTTGFATLPAGWDWDGCASLGGDGKMYAVVVDGSGFYSVVSVNLTTGTVTDIAGLHLTSSAEWYDYATADAAGNVWATVHTTPYPQASTTLRKWDGTTATDHAIQAVQEPFYDGDSNQTGNLLVDASGKLVLPMLTLQEGMHDYQPTPGANNAMWQATDTSFGYTDFFNTINCTTLPAVRPSHLETQPDVGVAGYSVEISGLGQPGLWDPLWRGNHGFITVNQVTAPFSETFRLSLLDGIGGAVIGTSGWTTGTATVTHDVDTAPRQDGYSVLLEVQKGSGTYVGDGLGNPTVGEASTFSLHYVFRTPAPNMEWFLHFDGTTPTRIAGTWDYTGVLTPLFSTDLGWADGPLADSVATSFRQNFGNVGMSADRSTLYFIDDSESWFSPTSAPVRYNLLRKLARCAPIGSFTLGGPALAFT